MSYGSAKQWNPAYEGGRACDVNDGPCNCGAWHIPTPDDTTTLNKPGVKADQGKLRFDLLPWKAIIGLVRVLTFGAAKYAPNGWRTVPNAIERYEAALLRHLAALKSGELVDKESGLRHIDHIHCNVAFISELMDE